MNDGGRPDMVFVSKRDWWISAILWGGVLVQGTGLAMVIATTDRTAEVALMLCFVAVAGTFMMWVLYGTHYTFHGRDLVIRCGPFRWTIKVDAINGAMPTGNPLSSPACSLDRLRIEYEGARRGVMISPLDKEEFLDELVERNPKLVVENGRAVRRSASLEASR